MNSGAVAAQDYVDIQNLYARYNHCSDTGDAEGYAACFSGDGVLQVDPHGLSVQGRESLVIYKRTEAAGRGGRYRRHWNGSLYLEKVDGNTVRGRCYFHGFNGRPGELPLFADAGVYDDTIVRLGGIWKFARRHLAIDGSVSLAAQTRT